MPQSPVPFHPLIYGSNSGAGLTAPNYYVRLDEQNRGIFQTGPRF
jgi:hypothetical protein